MARNNAKVFTIIGAILTAFNVTVRMLGIPSMISDARTWARWIAHIADWIPALLGLVIIAYAQWPALVPRFTIRGRRLFGIGPRVTTEHTEAAALPAAAPVAPVPEPTLIYSASDVTIHGAALASLDELAEIKRSMLAVETDAIIKRRFIGQRTDCTLPLSDIVVFGGQPQLSLQGSVFSDGFNGLVFALPVAEDTQTVVPMIRKRDVVKLTGTIERVDALSVWLRECRILEVWRPHPDDDSF